MRKYTNLFKDGTIKNEQEAYLLGFLYADGFLTNKYKGKYYSVGISLSSKDKDFLAVIGGLLGCEAKDAKQGKYFVSKIIRCDHLLVQRLVDFGFSGTKTLDQVDILKHIPENLMHHFIRGFFDGDGSIYKAENNTFAVGFVGMNKVLFDQLQQILSTILGRPVKYKMENTKYCRIRIKGNPSLIKIKDYLYRDATIYLSRKRVIFDQLKAYNGKNGVMGLCFIKKIKKWMVKVRGKYIGVFLSKKSAVEAIENHKNKC